MADSVPPTVSVVVPNYRHEKYLPERLDSILDQTFGDYEVILLDDASPDGSVAVLERYAARFAEVLGPDRVQTCFNTENSGSPFKQWNKGVELARGEYVWIAESDDVAEPGLLEALVGVLDQSVGVALAYCDSRRMAAGGELGDTMAKVHVDRVGGDWSQSVTIDGELFLSKYLSVGGMIPNASAVLFRRRAYHEAGGAALKWRMCGDWATWARLAGQGDVHFYAEPLNRWRRHPQTVRETIERGESRFVEVFGVLLELSQKVSRTPEVRGRAYRRWSSQFHAYLRQPGSRLSLGAAWYCTRALSTLFPEHATRSLSVMAWSKAFHVFPLLRALRRWGSVRV
ncbi:MAG: glycosyltransferase [Planctomycetota bacterium]